MRKREPRRPLRAPEAEAAQQNMTRRDFLIRAGAAAAALSLPAAGVFGGCARRRLPRGRKALIIGMDGMEPTIVEHMMNAGELPSFRRLAGLGAFRRVTSSIPPQSPIAWANFACGTDPGGHGIFDFIARDPQTYQPHFSIATVHAPEKTVRLGDVVLPLASGKVELLRRGPTFWQTLEEHGIPTTIFRMPSNFPPTACHRGLADLGAPDLMGTYGTFSFYTTKPPANPEAISGGRVYVVKATANVIRTKLHGPVNTLRAAPKGKESPEATLDLTFYLDPSAPVVKAVIGDQQVLLREGEWSEWIQVKFPMLWGRGVSGICRLYLKSVRPEFRLYITPLNIDPSAPALPISTPASYAQELYRRFGFFYTQGMPEDTKILSSGLFTDDEYLEQVNIVLRERLEMFDFELERFDEGLLFLYLSNTDRHGHMFWWARDPRHPAYDARLAPRYRREIEKLYRRMDEVVAKALRAVQGDDLLMVLSDHGFAPYYRSFQLNSWLRDNQYLVTWEGTKRDGDVFGSADWGYTKAYALGLNGLYLNIAGREGQGSVSAAEAPDLARELARRLMAVRDPRNGQQVISNVYLANRDYHGAAVREAPDLVIGYNRGYRASWQAAVGQFTGTLLDDNLGKWSGDHCIDYRQVPGVLFTNRTIRAAAPALYDLGPTAISYFGLTAPKEMTGRSIL